MTSATDGKIEVWEGIGFNGEVSEGPAEGNHYAELNATQASTLFQDVTGIAANEVVGWKLSHRGRTGEDTMRLTITDLGQDAEFGTLDDEVLFQDSFTDGMTWGLLRGLGHRRFGQHRAFRLRGCQHCKQQPGDR